MRLQPRLDTVSYTEHAINQLYRLALLVYRYLADRPLCAGV